MRGALRSVQCGRCGLVVAGKRRGWRTEVKWRWHRLVEHGLVTRGLP